MFERSHICHLVPTRRQIRARANRESKGEEEDTEVTVNAKKIVFLDRGIEIQHLL